LPVVGLVDTKKGKAAVKNALLIWLVKAVKRKWFAAFLKCPPYPDTLKALRGLPRGHHSSTPDPEM